MDFAELSKFAKSYAMAWCNQDPESVAAFYAQGGSLRVNDGPPAVGREAIAEVAQGFMRDFPDMTVTMDKVVADAKGIFFSLDAHRNQHRARRRRQACSNQGLRRVAA